MAHVIDRARHHLNQHGVEPEPSDHFALDVAWRRRWAAAERLLADPSRPVDAPCHGAALALGGAPERARPSASTAASSSSSLAPESAATCKLVERM